MIMMYEMGEKNARLRHDVIQELNKKRRGITKQVTVSFFPLS